MQGIPVFEAGEGRETVGRQAIRQMIRQQRVASIAVYPILYQPASRELTVFKSLVVTLTFTGGQTGDGTAESAVYEEFFTDELLNADDARQWRQAEGELEEVISENGGQPYPWSPPSPSWRVKVRADGFYKLTYAELETAGLPVTTLDPMTFQMYHMGNEVAIFVEDEADQVFDSDDYILFYGEKFTSKYTLDNVYWLTYEQSGVTHGLRMEIDDGTPGSAATPASYDAFRHYETNLMYWYLIPGDERLERWMWDYVQRSSKPSLTKNFTLGVPDTGAGTLTISLLGFSSDSGIALDHHARVSVNGTTLGDLTWDGQTFKTAALDIPAGVLVPGSNSLQVQVINDLGAANDTFYLDWFEVDFPDSFQAQSDALAFGYPAGSAKFQVLGEAGDGVLVQCHRRLLQAAWAGRVPPAFACKTQRPVRAMLRPLRVFSSKLPITPCNCSCLKLRHPWHNPCGITLRH